MWARPRRRESNQNPKVGDQAPGKISPPSNGSAQQPGFTPQHSCLVRCQLQARASILVSRVVSAHVTTRSGAALSVLC